MKRQMVSTKAEARFIVLVNQIRPELNYMRYISVKLGLSPSHTSMICYRLRVNRAIKTMRHHGKTIVTSVDMRAVKQAKKILDWN